MSFEPEKASTQRDGTGCSGSPGTWQEPHPPGPKGLLHTPTYAAVSSTALGSSSLPDGFTALPRNAGCQAGHCKGLEIVKQQPGTTGFNRGTLSLQKTHKHKSIPFREEELFVFPLVEAGIYGVLVMLGCLVVHRPLEFPTRVALGYTKNSVPL